jgi:hypothetical protein
VVAADGPLADLVDVRWADEADVGSARTDLCLNGVAHDAALADAASCGVDPDVGGLLGVMVEVVLDVVARNVEIADLASEKLDAAALAVADVAAVDNGLVQVRVIKEDAGAAAVVDVAAIEQHIAVALDEADAMAHLADEYADQCWLHDAAEFDAVCLRKGTDNLEAVNCRYALFDPDHRGEGRRVGAVRMGAEETQGGAGAHHRDPARATHAAQSNPAGLFQLDLDGATDAEVAARELQVTVGSLLNGMLQRGRVIAAPVALGAEVTDIAHAASMNSTDRLAFANSRRQRF